MVRDDAARTVLFDLDTAIQRLSVDVPDHPSIVQLTAGMHNLVAALVGHLDSCPWRISTAGSLRRHEDTKKT